MTVLTSIFPNGFTAPEPPQLQPPEIQLRIAIADSGLTPPDELVFDGKLHRFSTNGKKRDLSGWYVAHDGKLPAGAFGDWRSGMESTWRADIGRELNHVEMMQHSARMREVKALREKELAAIRENAAHQSQELWDAAPLASDEHPYIKRKGISNPGWRLAADGRLMAPVLIDGEVVSLQYIDANGGKLFAKGGKVGGGWWSIGGQPSDIMYLVEGVATAASVFEATGKPVGVAYSAGNLTATATALRALYPAVEIVIVADRDESGTGEREAKRASGIVSSVRVVVSPVGDANDYCQGGGDLLALLEPKDDILRLLDVVWANELPHEYTPPDELVQGVITCGSSSVVYGDSNSGKTFFVLDMCCAVARGVDWMGRKTEPGLVVYLATEAPASIMARVQAYQRHHECVVDNLAIVCMPLNFYTNGGDAVNVIKLVQHVEKSRGVPARLLVGDTLARMSAGANENSGEDMAPVMERFAHVSKATGAHMMTIHHNGKDAAKGARGWSGIRAHIDTEIELEEKDGARIATITKQRELSSKHEQIRFRLEVVVMGKTKWGEDATTCVVIQDDSEPVDKAPSESKAMATFRKYFEEAINSEGRFDSRIGKPFISTDAFNEFSKTKPHSSDGGRRNHLYKTKKALIDAGYVEVVQGGYAATDHPMMAGAFIGLRSF